MSIFLFNMFPCEIMKVVRNIFINIIGHRQKNLWDGDGYIDPILGRCLRKSIWHSMEVRTWDILGLNSYICFYL